MQGEWIRSGSVNATNGNNVVTGVSTAWQYSGVIIGDFFIGPDDNFYEITGMYKVGESGPGSYSSERITIKSLTGDDAYGGTTVTNGQYCIIRNWSNTTNALLASKIADLLQMYSSVKQGDTFLRLSSTAQIFNFDIDGEPNPTIQSITFNAFRQNLDDAQISFTTSPNIKSQVGDSGIFVLNVADMGLNKSVTVTVAAGGLSDSIVLFAVKEGKPGPQGPQGEPGEPGGLQEVTWEIIAGNKPPIDADKTPVMPFDEYLRVYWSFDEGRGELVKDNTFSRIDADYRQLYGTAIGILWEAGISGSCAQFDRTYSLDFDATEFYDLVELTWSCWIKSAGMDDEHLNTMGIHNRNGIGSLAKNSYYFYITRDGFLAFDSQIMDDAPSVYDNQWHHCVFVFTGSQVKIYLDSKTSETFSYVPDARTHTVGTLGRVGDATTVGAFFGSIDEVRVYKKALSSEEIGALFKTPGGNKSSIALDTTGINGIPAAELTTRLSETETVANTARAEFQQMAEDDHLTAAEKKKAREEWPELNHNYAKLISHATRYNKAVEPFYAAYQALADCLMNQLQIFDNPDTGTTVTGFRQIMNNYFYAYNDLWIECNGAANDMLDFAYNTSMSAEETINNILDDDVINISEKYVLLDQIGIIEAEYPRITAQASVVGLRTEEPYDTEFVYPYMVAYSEYLVSLEDAVANMYGISETGGTLLRERSAAYTRTKQALITESSRLATTLTAPDTDKVGGIASEDIVNDIISVLAFAEDSEDLFTDMASDDKLTKVEKSNWRARWVEVSANYDTMIDLATRYNISTTDLVNAKTALLDYLENTALVWSAPNDTTSVPNLATRVGNYYSALNNLLIIRQTTDTATRDTIDTIQDDLDNGVYDGQDGQGVVKSFCFIRATSAPDTPTGGTYDSPLATGWSDGIPSGTDPVWQSTRIFTSDGLPPHQDVWTAPSKISDRGQGSKVEFSIDDISWHDTPATDDLYMRSSVSTDGGVTWTPSSGSVKIKGEDGDDGVPGDDGVDAGNWGSTFTFSSTAYNSITWSGGTLYSGTNGYTIAAGSITGMSTSAGVVYYIYFDPAVSTSTLQSTTTAANSVGSGKVVVAVAKANSNTSSTSCQYQAFGGNGGLMITADNIAAESITANKIAANAITASMIQTSGITIGNISGASTFTAYDTSYINGTAASTVKNNASTGATYGAGLINGTYTASNANKLGGTAASTINANISAAAKTANFSTISDTGGTLTITSSKLVINTSYGLELTGYGSLKIKDTGEKYTHLNALWGYKAYAGGNAHIFNIESNYSVSQFLIAGYKFIGSTSGAWGVGGDVNTATRLLVTAAGSYDTLSIAAKFVGTVYVTSTLYAQGNTVCSGSLTCSSNGTGKSVKQTTISTGNASGGVSGDIWMKY